jgi:ADP-ribosyl-[dinitrogen reductase] hydrolase
MKMIDKIKGSIYGVAVGDALGAPIEAERPSTIARKYGVLRDMHGSPSFEPGEFTDDTWLTLSACRAYETDTFNPERAGECMVIWMRTNGKGIGHMTNQALACISSGRETVFNAGKKALASMGRGRGAGNGSLMRCVATGLAHPREEIDTITKESRIISEITHADKSCVASCIAYNIILSNIMADEKDIETCIDSTAQLVDTINQDTSDIMMNALSGKLRFVAGEMTQTGYVLRAFERALTSLLHGTSFEDEMVKVINEGGDADTNGAIAGGLLGAKYGYDAIPDRWIRDLKHKDELDEAVDIICKFRGI